MRRLNSAVGNSRVAVARLTYLAYVLYGESAEPARVAAANYRPSTSAKPSSRLVHQYTPGSIAGQAPAALESTLDKLLQVPEEEVGGIAICASIKNEARFITEWLLYNRAIGVDRFYLYDKGSTDNTLEVLQPWIETGVVVLHEFKADQGDLFQLNALETCSRTYGLVSDWILDCDVDEFYVATPAPTSRQRRPAAAAFETPDYPLRRLLFDHYIYTSVDAVATSRVTWKNAGFARLPEKASVLASQTLRGIDRAVPYGKLEYTKSLLRSTKKPGWYESDLNPKSARLGPPSRRRNTVHVLEPLVMYHYVERDLENCLDKLETAQKGRKGGRRVQAGDASCKSPDLYQADDERGKGGYYAGAVEDVTMARSWYGQHLPGLIELALARADSIAAGGELHQPKLVDPHPVLVAMWRAEGKNLQNGMELDAAEKGHERSAREVGSDEG
ncbi:hypothetical protein JCM9279_001415 [Rhodotorula babjevae]